MSVRATVLMSVIPCLFWLFSFGVACAQNCHDVEPAASRSLQPVTLPPAPSNKCSIRLKDGYPIADPACTPGAINPTVTLEILRDPQFRTSCSTNRRVSATDKAQTYVWYGITIPQQNIGASQTCALDYLIPLELGGADSLANVWPLCGPPGATLAQRYFRQKILVTQFLLAQVKSGDMTLADVQNGVAANWAQYADEAYAFSHHMYHHHRWYWRRHEEPIEKDPRVVMLFLASTRGIERIRRPTNSLELVPTDVRNIDASNRPVLTFGSAMVRVPDDHIAGQVERPFCLCLFGLTLYRQPENPQKHFTLKATRWLSQDEFLDELNGGSDQVLVFVHGFNTTLDDGLYRLAQIVFDSHFKGSSILFSWPSKGGVADYWYDADSAKFSVDGLRELIELLQADEHVSTIHVIAHSMGNRIVLDALANPGSSKSLGQLVLAAPDVDSDVFKVEEPKLTGFRRVTLYASSKDWALKLSEKLASDFARAGDVPAPPGAPVVLPPMDTIDASLLGTDLLGLNHDTFAASAALCDIGRLLRNGGEPPNLRTSAIRPDAGPPSYWRYTTMDASWDPRHGCK